MVLGLALLLLASPCSAAPFAHNSLVEPSAFLPPSSRAAIGNASVNVPMVSLDGRLPAENALLQSMQGQLSFVTVAEGRQVPSLLLCLIPDATGASGESLIAARLASTYSTLRFHFSMQAAPSSNLLATVTAQVPTFDSYVLATVDVSESLSCAVTMTSALRRASVDATGERRWKHTTPG